MAGQREAVEPAHLLELLRRHRAMGLGGEELAGAGHGLARGRAASRLGAVAAHGQKLGQSVDQGVLGQRLEWLREIGKGLGQQIGQR